MTDQTMTNELLDIYVRKWQAILHLQDWHVTAELAGLKDMNDKFNTGCIMVHAECREAKIQVVPKEDRAESWCRDHDYETLIVHELLHIFFDPFDTAKGSPQRLAEEQAVDAIARALVNRDRGLGTRATLEQGNA